MVLSVVSDLAGGLETRPLKVRKATVQASCWVPCSHYSPARYPRASLLSSVIDFACLELYDISSYVLFCGWFLKHNILYVKIILLYMFIYSLCCLSFHCKNLAQLIYPFYWWAFGMFRSEVITNGAVLDVLIHVFLVHKYTYLSEL